MTAFDDFAKNLKNLDDSLQHQEEARLAGEEFMKIIAELPTGNRTAMLARLDQVQAKLADLAEQARRESR